MCPSSRDHDVARLQVAVTTPEPRAFAKRRQSARHRPQPSFKGRSAAIRRSSLLPATSIHGDEGPAFRLSRARGTVAHVRMVQTRRVREPHAESASVLPHPAEFHGDQLQRAVPTQRESCAVDDADTARSNERENAVAADG